MTSISLMSGVTLARVDIVSLKTNLLSETVAIKRDSYLPHVKGGHYEEIDRLLYHCGLMPHPLLSYFLFEYRLKVELII